MLQTMIVDDEMHAVDGIKRAVDWERIGIGAVFTAYSLRQAKEVLDKHPIDIMICDIEMPQGSGLELMSWVKGHYPKIQVIFLTCHADFNYAKQAIKLGCIDYILKPVPSAELEAAVLQVVDKVNRENKIREDSRFSNLWLKHQPLLYERFWTDIITQSIPSRREEIRKAAEERNIQFMERMQVCLVLIRVQRWIGELSLSDEKLKERSLKHYAEEMILKGTMNGHVIMPGKGELLVIYYLEQDASFGMDRLKVLCESYIDACNRNLECDLSCYLTNKADIQEVASLFIQLRRLDEDNVAFMNKVYLLNEQVKTDIRIKMPDMAVWSVMMAEGSREKLLSEATGCLKEWMQTVGLDARMLNQFHQDFMQMIHAALIKKGIQAHQFLNESATGELFTTVPRTVNDLVLWMERIVTQVGEYLDTLEQSQTVVEKVRKFVNLHIGENLTREVIANHVYLNPDYLTRIFKKETGFSLTEYIVRERLEIAKDLLRKTDLPVHAVATHIGYTNFSHFSKTFKKYTKRSPNDFRQSKQEK